MTGVRPRTKTTGNGGKSGSPIDPRYIVPGLSRGLALLALFTRQSPALALVELARGLRLSRSAAYRLVYTLEKDGFLSRDDETRKYRLTSKTLSLGFEYLHSQTITEIAQPHLRSLSDRTAAAAHIAILDGWHAVYLARAVPSIGLVSNLQIGARLPAHTTSSGRIMLAFQDDERLQTIYQRLRREGPAVQVPASFRDFRAHVLADRKRGYVFHKSTVDPGLVSLACPIRDHDSTTVAAVTVIVPEKLSEDLGGEKTLRPLVSETAQAISKKIGYRG
jgi:IclR family pca regulon transcriptional regulator